MKVQFDQEENIFTIQLTKKKVDHAYETETMIVHVTEDNEPVLLEIFDAARFFTMESKSLPDAVKEKYFSA